MGAGSSTKKRVQPQDALEAPAVSGSMKLAFCVNGGASSVWQASFKLFPRMRKRIPRSVPLSPALSKVVLAATQGLLTLMERVPLVGQLAAALQDLCNVYQVRSRGCCAT